MKDLMDRNLWNDEILEQLKSADGNLDLIASIPEDLKNLYKEAFDIDPIFALKLTATRGKWIDQSQSHNVFIKGVSGKNLNEVYIAAWKYGLKTTYYLRSLGASQTEKTTTSSKNLASSSKRNLTELKSPSLSVPITPLLKTPVSEIEEKLIIEQGSLITNNDLLSFKKRKFLEKSKKIREL